MSNESFVTPDDYMWWKNHPVTKMFFNEIQEKCQEYQKLWAKGDLLLDPINNARRVGHVEALSGMLGFIPESMVGEYEKNN